MAELRKGKAAKWYNCNNDRTGNWARISIFLALGTHWVITRLKHMWWIKLVDYVVDKKTLTFEGRLQVVS